MGEISTSKSLSGLKLIDFSITFRSTYYGPSLCVQGFIKLAIICQKKQFCAFLGALDEMNVSSLLQHFLTLPLTASTSEHVSFMNARLRL